MALEVCCQLIPSTEILRIVPLLRERNPLLTEETLGQRVLEMVAQGYQCLGAYIKDELVGIAGIWIRTRYHTGKLIEADHVYVSKNYQSQNIGQTLINWVLDYGRRQGCLESELHCYVDNHLGHRFWLKQGYDIIAHHFGKKLSNI